MAYVSPNASAVRAQETEREELDRLVREFELAGGNIERLPPGATSETVGLALARHPSLVRKLDERVTLVVCKRGRR